MSFFQELKRRNVVRAALAYVVAAWLIIQVVETILPLFGFGEAFIRSVVIVLAIGLIPVLVVAWVFELTPDGLKREKEVDYESPAFRRFGRKLDRVVMILLAVGLIYFAFDKFVLDPARDAELINVTAQLVEQAVLNRTPEKSIAILPFVNRSSLQKDEYFSDGIHDDLLTTVAKIGSIKVISRTSVMEYKNTTKKIPQIAKELGVANILEGGVQRSGNQVRINVQLISAETDEHLWAETYDRELTTENLFAIQSEVSKSVAEAMQATLSPDEEQRLNLRPTDSLPAYDAYLSARQLMESREPEKLSLAVEAFNKAVELDPGFALAWVGVAESRARHAMVTGLPSDESTKLQEEAINRALAIDPNRGEAYAALGLLYRQIGRFDEVEDAFTKAVDLSPNYARAWYAYAEWVLNFQTRIDEAIEMGEKAADLDPRSVMVTSLLGRAYEQRGLFTLAEREYLKVIDMDPGYSEGLTALGSMYLHSVGPYDAALHYLLRAKALAPGDIYNRYLILKSYLELGDIGAARATRAGMGEVDNEHPLTAYADLQLALYENDSTESRKALDRVLSKISGIGDWAAQQGMVELILGEKRRARDVYLRYTPGWLDPEEWPELLELFKKDACIVAWILISTGDIELGKKLLENSLVFFDEILPTVFEHPNGNFPEICYLAAGDSHKAIESIETQLSHNHLTDWTVIHKLPMFDLIRDEPRYQAALDERELRIEAQRKAVNIEQQLRQK